MTKPLDLDFDGFTLDEAILFEETAGHGFGEAMEIMKSGKGPMMRILAAFGYVIARRGDEDLDFAEFRKTATFSDLTGTVGKASKTSSAKSGSGTGGTTGSKSGRSRSTSSGGSRRKSSGG